MAALLIVENNEFFRKLLKDYLKKQFPGLSIHEAADGETALQRIKVHPPEIVLMDIQLPGRNGLKLTKEIKTSYPQTAIFLFANYEVPELREIAYENGADCLIHKDSLISAGIPQMIQSVLSKRDRGADDYQRPGNESVKPLPRPSPGSKPAYGNSQKATHDFCR